MFDHRQLDPRSKLAFTLVVVGLTVWATRFELLGVVGGTVILVVWAGRGLGFGQWLGFVRPLKLLIPAIFVLNALFYVGGPVIWSLPLVPLSVTRGGLLTSSLLVVRLLLIAGVAAWFARTTAAEEFELALVSLRIPWSLAFVLSLSLRLVPEMQDRYQTVEDAQRARGLTLGGGPLSRARGRIPTLIPFFVAVIEFGYELADALEVRDFGRTGRRTSLISINHGRPDYVIYGLSVALAAGVPSLPL